MAGFTKIEEDFEIDSSRSSSLLETLKLVDRIIFDVPITEFRFYATAPATGSANNGRICIGNMIVYTKQ